MKIGIIQGRLTQPIQGHQTTPDLWRDEFLLLENLGLSHIEWTIDNKRLFDNPILHDTICDNFLKKISSVCFDNLVTDKVFDSDFFDKNCLCIVDLLNKRNIHSITIPMVESAGIRDSESLLKISKSINKSLEKYPKLIIHIESDSEIHHVSEILKIDERVRFTYDTGNITAANFCHERYIDHIFDKIENIHLKDRKRNSGPSLAGFLGDTDFKNIFKILSRNEYRNIFTLQMARENNRCEQKTITNYVNFFRSLYEEYF